MRLSRAPEQGPPMGTPVVWCTKTVLKLIITKTQVRLDSGVECLRGKNQSIIVVSLKTKRYRGNSFCSFEDLDQTMTSCFDAADKVVVVSKYRTWFYSCVIDVS